MHEVTFALIMAAMTPSGDSVNYVIDHNLSEQNCLIMLGDFQQTPNAFLTFTCKKEG